MKRLFIIAGEHSSDRYASVLIRAIKKQDPQIYITVVGGPCMAEAADELVDNIVHAHLIGFLEQIFRRRFYRRVLNKCEKVVSQSTFDCAIVMDFPHYHHYFSDLFRRFQVMQVSYITPHFWMYGDTASQARLVRDSEHIVTIFEKEKQVYETQHPSVHYFGHPMGDVMDTPPQDIDVRSDQIVTLFPGSRDQEVRRLLPVMVDVAERLEQEGYLVYVSYSNSIVPNLLAELGKSGWLWIDSEQKLKSITSVGICSAGTMTLDLVYHGVPQVVLGAVSWLTYALFHVLGYRLPFIALPNMILDRDCIPEYRQRFPIQTITETVKRLMLSEQRDMLKSDYATLQNIWGGDQSPSSRIADFILTQINSKKR